MTEPLAALVVSIKKVASASESGVCSCRKIFFAPEDEITKEEKEVDPSIKTNYQEALAAAKKLGTGHEDCTSLKCARRTRLSQNA